MRNRQEITEHYAGSNDRIQRALLLEVLLDIRDLLKEIVNNER